jgi:cytochrome c biogenesis protein CcmG/thiol:disulfide interchange protein DsbE
LPSTPSSSPTEAPRRSPLILAAVALVVVVVVGAVTWIVVADSRQQGSAAKGVVTPELDPPLADVSVAGVAPVGSAAPDFRLTTLDGHSVQLSDYRGRPVVINFFASWCNPCRAEFPILRKELAAHHGDYVMLGIDYRDISSDARDFVKSQHAGWPMLSDPDNMANTAYGIRAVPQTIFVDRSGVIAERIPQQLTTDAFRAGLAKILTGSPAPTRS